MKINFNQQFEFPLIRLNKVLSIENEKEHIFLRFRHNDEVEETLKYFIKNNIIFKKIVVVNEYNDIVFESDKEYFLQQYDNDVSGLTHQLIANLKEI